jgi:NAD(P)-dependent dehydrogenase (short-subunit alcohol dehydrogenase family)
MKEFTDKVAVITGAASGIGRGLADRFASEGMRVVLADVEEQALADAEREMKQAGAKVLAVRTDVSRAEDVDAVAQKTVEHFGGVHILCNNAGVGRGGPSWEIAAEDWRWVLGVNLWGVINGVRAFVPIMLQQGEEGHIVNTASVAGLIAGAGDAAYTASKFGVVGLTETLYGELAMASGGKIGVSLLCPALTNTRILDAGRNHPSGPLEQPEVGTPERGFLDMMRGIFQGGMAPSETASIVFDAIVAGRFYVLTHPEHNDRLMARAEAIINDGTPQALMPG